MKKTKNGEEHEVPLSDAAIAIIQSVKRTACAENFIFTTTGRSAVSGFSKAKRQIDEKIKELTGRTLEHWRFHDLRRTAATGMEKLKIPLQVTEAALNHVAGSKSGIVGIYQQHKYDSEKRDALEKWAAYVERVVSSKNNTGHASNLD